MGIICNLMIMMAFSHAAVSGCLIEKSRLEENKNVHIVPGRNAKH